MVKTPTSKTIMILYHIRQIRRTSINQAQKRSPQLDNTIISSIRAPFDNLIPLVVSRFSHFYIVI